MPLYDYRCPDGHRFERNVALADDSAQSCPACGATSVKVPSRVALGGTARTGRSLEQMPQTWRGTYNGNREYITQLQREWATRQRLEDKHPELQGDRRPVLAHEGRFEHAPLRAGDPLPDPSEPHTHGHGSHPHAHPHGEAATRFPKPSE